MTKFNTKGGAEARAEELRKNPTFAHYVEIKVVEIIMRYPSETVGWWEVRGLTKEPLMQTEAQALSEEIRRLESG